MSFNPEVFLNGVIFAMFFAIISTELMAASAIIFKYEESTRKVFYYLVPIWEITGTFFVFYVVNVEALIPDALPILAYSYISYILIFIVIYITRNVSIISAEFIFKNKWKINRRMLYSLYAIMTYVLGFFVLVIYTSLMSGHGLNITTRTFNMGAFLGYLPDDGFILGSAIVLFGMASIFYRLEVNAILSLVVTVLGLIVAGVSFVVINDVSNVYLMVASGIVTVAIPVLYIIPQLKQYISDKIIFQGFLAVSAFLLFYSVYPNLSSKAINVNTLLNNSAMQTQIFYATLIGGTLLLIMSLVFFRIWLKSSKMHMEAGAGEVD
jgi:cytochrome d ubiquinol oxidase subunit II